VGERERLRNLRQEEKSSRFGTTTKKGETGITTPLVFSRGLLVWCFAFPFLFPSSLLLFLLIGESAEKLLQLVFWCLLASSIYSSFSRE